MSSWNPWRGEQPAGSSTNNAAPGSSTSRGPLFTTSSLNPSSAISLEPPQLSVPKAGGALSSLGEKYDVNPSLGTGSFAVPIPTTQTLRGNTVPNLSLSYNSGSGNSIFGYGWDVGIGAITRKTDDGVPQYNDNDTFILSGAEDLVPLLTYDTATSSWIDPGATPATVDGIAYQVHRFRPRTEGTFTSIERWTPDQLGSNGTYWRVLSASNETNLYGSTIESRIFDPEEPSRIFSWLLCEVRDATGNIMVIDYKREDSSGLDLDSLPLHERNRSIEKRTANLYPKSIKYGNRVSTLSTRPHTTEELDNPWLFEVAFDYGEHDANRPTSSGDGTWSLRSDPFSTYKCGFEIRTYRLCRRILLFHHFPQEEIGRDCLVKSMNLNYGTVDPDSHLGARCATVLTSLEIGSYKQTAAASGRYDMKTSPPIDFRYTTTGTNFKVQDLDPLSLEDMPMPGSGTPYLFVDLYGDGMPGILFEVNAPSTSSPIWFFKRGLGRGKYATAEKLANKPFGPSLASVGPSNFEFSQLLDINGDGLPEMVSIHGNFSGFSRTRTFSADGIPPTPPLSDVSSFSGTEDNWDPFVEFDSVPQIDWNSPHVCFADLTGNGTSDILCSDERGFHWYRSVEERGFVLGESAIILPHDEEEGPRHVFTNTDTKTAVLLADMTGGGLTDIVRIRNGETCYWPNLGYGRFGPKVSMSNSPKFDRDDTWDPNRIRLADIDGTGTADVIYFGGEEAGGVLIFYNESGNSLSTPVPIPSLPAISNDLLSDIQIADVLGTGTACIAWFSSHALSQGHRSFKFVDLNGGVKPFLLSSIINNLGAETHLEYTSSAWFCSDDRLARKPWHTILPFPVQVVSRVTRLDNVGHTHFSSCYAYHHGFYDGTKGQREIRGFALVEQWDTESFDILINGTEAVNITNQASHVPPVHTKTWFHVGAWLGSRGGIDSRFLTGEYWDSPLLPAAVLPEAVSTPNGITIPHALSASELREASRALRGSVLRTEVYSIDGSANSANPYIISENRFAVDLLQPSLREPAPHAVFMPRGIESVTVDLDRAHSSDDARIRHQATLKTDYFGNSLTDIDIVYGRRSQHQDSSILDAEGKLWQQKSFSVLNQCRYTNSIGMEISSTSISPVRQLPKLFDQQVFQLHNIVRPSPRLLFSLSDLGAMVDASRLLPELPFSDAEGTTQPQRNVLHRLLSRSRVEFRSNDLKSVLPFGTVESLGILSQSYTQLFTDELLQKVFIADGLLSSSELESKLLNEGQTVRLQGNDGWWAPSSSSFFTPTSEIDELVFARDHFFLPHRFVSPFDTNRPSSTVRYDQYDLLVLETEDSMGNRVSAGVRDLLRNGEPLDALSMDYRVMAPTTIMDPNGNMTKTGYDVFAVPSVVATMGKPNMQHPNLDSSEGDSIHNMPADLDDSTVRDFFRDPSKSGLAHTLLGTATSCVVYDQLRYSRSPDPGSPPSQHRLPGVMATITRDTHASESHAQRPNLQISLMYSDGVDRTIQTKTLVDDGSVKDDDPSTFVTPRWITSGWTIFDNKGNIVRKYEPFFSGTADFEFGATKGVASTTFYDPLSRPVLVLSPDHSWSKVVVGNWSSESWDANDTVGIPDPRNDPDVGHYFRRLTAFGDSVDDPSPLFWPIWATRRLSGALGMEEQRAAQKSLVHANTPGTSHIDAAGRVFASSTVNRTQRTGGSVETEQLMVRQYMDIQGNPYKILNANAITVQTSISDMASRALKVSNMDSGRRWSLLAIDNQPIVSFNERGDCLESYYDAARRPLQSRLVDHAHGLASGQLVLKIEYGEGRNDAVSNNLKGQTIRVYDQTGVVVSEAYDFKGNPLSIYRQFSKEYKSNIDWGASPGPVLLPTKYRTVTKFDALNRATEVELLNTTTVKPRYSQAGNIISISARLEGNALFKEYVTNVKHNARGQRLEVQYGNGTTTKCSYDPLTFRLHNITSIRDPTIFPGDDPTPSQPGWSGRFIQNLSYVYDCVGNVCSVTDAAQQRIYFDGAIVDASQSFIYDALYRLVEASGREHQSAGYDARDAVLSQLQHPNNGLAMRRYTETYNYDKANNILAVQHASGASGSITRQYTYGETSTLDLNQKNNRLSSVVRGGVRDSFSYDSHGNMTSLPQLERMEWDFGDRLKATARQRVRNGNSPETTYYTYGASGERARKVTESFAAQGTTPSIQSQRIYVGCLEIYEEFPSSVTVIDDSQPRSKRSMLIKLTDAEQGLAHIERDLDTGATSTRYQLTNHVGSVAIELDDASNIVSYEEYSPFGSTTYQGHASVDIPRKRYRYTGRERDEESGLCYHSARYYLPWIGRWASIDPGGLQDGLNVYCYCQNSPVVLIDPGGGQSVGNDDIVEYNIHSDEAFKGESFPDEERTPRETVEREANKNGIGVAGAMHWRGQTAVFEHIWKISPGHPADDEFVGYDVDDVIEVTATPPEDGTGGQSSDGDAQDGAEGADGTSPADAAETNGGGEQPWYVPGAGSVGSNLYNIGNFISRTIYQSRIKEVSDLAVNLIDDAMSRRDYGAAMRSIKLAVKFRNLARSMVRTHLSNVGRIFSEWADATKPLSELARKYSFDELESELASSKPWKGVRPPKVELGEWARRIARASGRSVQAVKRLYDGSFKFSARGAAVSIGKWVGPAMAAVGAYNAIDAIRNAPPGMRGRVAAHEAGAFLGGLAATILFDLALAGVVVSGGWAVLGVMALGAVLGAAGSYFGGKLGDKVASWRGW
ncbi:insecticidal toxin complex protein [Dendryphion nanum]|uniref:Insecticidal toxin complex protein n=1 Tax=Dendryphion nanum TaxID=256645 RepID=A0A9P9I6R8_9PLEO|nr:insecticidal toxin complex protein [Dendryphion nanum]